MRTYWRCIAIILTVFVLRSLPSLRAQMMQHVVKAEDSPRAVVLTELFTSEGCSSCPPADSLLRQINGTRTHAGQLIVGISEHVTYWNGLGWSDPYSSEIYTARQNAYGRRFNLDSVYTPQIVINGTEQIVGSDQEALLRAFEKESQRPQVPLHILETKIAGSTLALTFSVSGTLPGQGADIVVVFADDSDRSSVLRGENSGRTLVHVAVARYLARVATVHEAVEKTVEVPIPPSFQKGQTVGRHLVVFAQTTGLGPVIGVDIKPL